MDYLTLHATILYIFLFAGILLLYIIRGEDKINPYFIFTLFWLFVFVCFLYCTCKFKLYPVSIKVINIYGIGILAFNLSNIRKIKVKNNCTFTITNTDIDNKRVICLYSIGLCLAFIFWKRAINLVSQGYSTAQIRNLFLNPIPGGAIRSSFEMILYNVVVTPLEYAAIVLVPVKLFDKKRNRIVSAILITYLFICDPAGGRIVYLNIAIILIVFLIFWANNNMLLKRKNYKKKKKFIIFTAVLMVGCMYAVSLSRGIDADRLMNQFMIYYGGSITYAGQKIVNIPQELGYTYGMSFGASCFRILFKIYNIFNIGIPQNWEYLEAYISSFQKFIEIGKGIKFNAFAGAFYYFYLDGGIIAVFAESFLWGIGCRYIYKKSIETKRSYYISIYLLLIIGITTSMIRWTFFQWQYTFAFFNIWCLRKKLPDK